MRSIGWTGLGMASLAALAWNAPAMAGDMVDDKLATMEQRIKYLEERVASQDQMIVDKEGEIAGLSDGWFNSVEVAGTIELELVSASPADGDGGTEAGVGKAELAIGGAFDDEWSGEIVVKGSDDIKLDAATVTYEPGGLSATMGLQGLPFGVYDTNLVSDPLTKDLGDTGEVSLVVGGEAGQLGWSVFAFDGDNAPEDEDHIAGFGAALSFAMEGDGTEFGLDVSWINHIGDTDTLGDAASFANQVAGMAASAHGRMGDASVLVETVTALDSLDFDGSGASPSAWMVEAAYDLALGGRDATVAIGFQGSDEAEAAGLDETAMLMGVSVGISENVGIGVEWRQSEGYGADGTDDTITVLLAAEF